ncbi:MAG TPA: Tic20 family protein [Coleofasciculaceae cyanobacterium]
MTWRGSPTVKDRIFACLPYLLPLIEGLLRFGELLIQFPALQLVFLPLAPIIAIYTKLGSWGGLILFFVLFLAVVRNERIAHFIRFNTMQALLLDILLVLIGLVLGILQPVLGSASLVANTLINIVFLGVVIACGYSIVQSLTGRYAEIPSLSEAAYAQVR